ncbi:MAG: ISAs1 family transposase, partial [Solirubrobacteraceae bacterium]
RAALRAIAVDGKLLRGSGAAGFAQVTLLAALDHTVGTVLAQRQIGGKTNEIPEARILLGAMDIAGSVITMDALHTQRETARQLREHDAHYVLTVKANQPALLGACHRRITVEGHASGEHHESERTRGKIRERHLTTADAEGIDFPGAKQIARIIRYTRRPGTAGRLTKEVVYVITSLPPELAGPGELAALVRGHWRIENQCHYVRDVTFCEDKSAISTAALPRIMATLRNLVISMLRLAGETNIAKALRRHARRPELLTELLHLT